MNQTREFRGISTRAAIGYLENLGGEQREHRVVVGDDWRAELDEQIVEIGPTLKLNQVTVSFEGDKETLEPLIEKFAQKAIRAGG